MSSNLDDHYSILHSDKQRKGSASIKGIVLKLVVALILVSVLSSTCQATTYRRYTNKIFYSVLDSDMVLIAPNDNSTLICGFAYDFTFFEPHPVNFTIRYNETAIALKGINDKCILSSFFVNDTTFTINIIKTNSNKTQYITIHYNAEKNPYVKPWIGPNPPPEEVSNNSLPTFSTADLIFISSIVMGLFLLGAPWIGYSIKYIKEKTAKVEDIGPDIPYYRSK